MLSIPQEWDKVIADASSQEGVSPTFIREGLTAGTIVMPRNRHRTDVRPVAIGAGMRIKVNANLGNSPDASDLETEIRKLKVAIDAGADTVMDLSTGKDLRQIREAMLEQCPVPLGTVPIYEACSRAVETHRAVVELNVDELFQVIEDHAREGVDFITVHCGVTQESVDRLRNQGRLTDVVSRGGALLVEWMVFNHAENPLYEYYDRLLDIARDHSVTLSLGDGLRPGSLADATDRAQIQELILIGELVDRAREAGVQAMVEGPGHIPLNQVEANVLLEKELCKGAPFYVLGPLVTDISPGYDHIAAAIGGAIAGAAGADFLCYVTPAEHLRLPDPDDVREGVMALRIAAHAADISRGVKGAFEWDRRISKARKQLDWETVLDLAIDTHRARQMLGDRPLHEQDVCTMCGDYCAMKRMGNIFSKTEERR
jgi:phosphomethylpyrimidine synthase